MDEGATILVFFRDGEDFATTNPFKIAAEIRRLVGEIEAARPDSKGNLLVTTKTRRQTETLLEQDRFMDRAVQIDCPIRYNSVEAYIYAPTLTEVDDEEIITELRDQGVIGVYRLRPTHGKTNPGLRLTILGKTIPPHIRAGFQDIPLRPWRRSPLLCRRCASYGHSQKHCRAGYLRCLRCSGEHSTDNCEAAASRCPHCEGNHPAWDRRCATLQAFFQKQETPAMRAPATLEDAATQTAPTTTRDAATTSAPRTCSAATGPGPEPDRKSTASQTDKLPVFHGTATIIDEEEEEERSPDQDNIEEHRWDYRTQIDQGDAELPPAARTRSTYKRDPPPQKTNQDEHPELEDPELMPKPKRTTKQEDDHQHVFTFHNGYRPAGTVTHLYRYNKAVRVIDLDLRPGTKAHQAASKGFYFDQPGGLRLFLQRAPSPLVG